MGLDRKAGMDPIQQLAQIVEVQQMQIEYWKLIPLTHQLSNSRNEYHLAA
jgi:hypothetical protein